MVNSVVKAVEVLEAFDRGKTELSLGEIAAQLDMPKSSVHRLAGTLERVGFLARAPETGKYRLGIRLLRLTAATLASLDLRSAARPQLELLAGQLQDTVHLGVLDAGEVIYIDKIESLARVQMISHVGGRVPVHCTGLGKAMLAYRPEEEIRRIAAQRGLAAFTPATITSLEALLSHLAEVRATGYAVDPGEHEPLVRCVAAPVRDYRGAVIGAISATTTKASWEPGHRETMIRAVLETATRVSQAMGWAGGMA